MSIEQRPAAAWRRRRRRAAVFRVTYTEEEIAIDVVGVEELRVPSRHQTH
jgi:hypothetical protein